MPIYAYKCESCGFAKDVLQKMSDAPLETCPACEKPSFKKQLTAAGFQLKGSGWYATDFKGGGTAAPTPTVSSDGGASAAPAADSATPANAAKAAKADAAPATPSVPAAPNT